MNVSANAHMEIEIDIYILINMSNQIRMDTNIHATINLKCQDEY